MEGLKGGVSGVSGLQAAVLEFVENNGALKELDAFCRAFAYSNEVSPRTIRGTGIDDSDDKRVSDPHFHSHDFLQSPTKLVEIGIVHPNEVVSLPYLHIGYDKKPTLLATTFMGKAPESADHVIPKEVRNGAAGMKKMVDFVLQDKVHRGKFSSALDILKVLHLFQLSAVHKSLGTYETAPSIDDFDKVFEILAKLEVTKTESLMRSIYQRLFDKPKTKALLEKMKVEAKTAAELRNWVETDGFLNPAAASIVSQFKAHIERDVVDHSLNLKKALLEFVQGLKKRHLGLEANPNANGTAADVKGNIAGIEGVVSKRLMKTVGMAPVITHLSEELPKVEEAPISVVPASVAPASQAPMSEAPRTLVSPPPAFEDPNAGYTAIVPTRIVSIGGTESRKPHREATPVDAEILATVRAGFQYFQSVEGRTQVKIGFAHKFEFCDFLLNKDFEIGDLVWENLSAYKLAELFDSNTPAGVNGLLNFFRTTKWVREEIRNISKKRVPNDDYVREQCSEIFTSLFS